MRPKPHSGAVADRRLRGKSRMTNLRSASRSERSRWRASRWQMELDNNAVSSATKLTGPTGRSIRRSRRIETRAPTTPAWRSERSSVRGPTTQRQSIHAGRIEGRSRHPELAAHSPARCPTRTRSPTPTRRCSRTDGEQILYFGANRDANNGAADFGFWFLQTEVPRPTRGTGTFDRRGWRPRRAHGGRHPPPGHVHAAAAPTCTIRAFVWDPANATINGVLTDPGVTLADCDDATATDSGCGTVNAPAAGSGDRFALALHGEVSADPSTVNPHKNQSKNGIFPSGSFFEGGINLSDFDLEGCFSTFVAETRSSPEVGVSAEGLRASAASSPAMSASDDDHQPADSVSPRRLSHGHARPSRAAARAPPRRPATVTFFLCGPTSRRRPTSATARRGTSAHRSRTPDPPTPVALDGTSNPSTVHLRRGRRPTAVGRYCFRAEYSGDGTLRRRGPTSARSLTGDPNGTECFVVEHDPDDDRDGCRGRPRTTRRRSRRQGPRGTTSLAASPSASTARTPPAAAELRRARSRYHRDRQHPGDRRI